MQNDNCLKLLRYKKEGSGEVSGEFTLSDYQTEIKRILKSEVNVFPPEKQINGDKLILRGTLSHEILYIGIDNRLYSASFPNDYEIEIKVPENCKDSEDSPVFVKSENFSVRQTGPRKISAKGRVSASAVCFSEADKTECMTENFLPGGCEALTEKAEYVSLSLLGGEMLELSDEYISEFHTDSERIIECSGKVFVGNADCREDGIVVRGEVLADILSSDDATSEAPRVQRRKIPFEKTLDVVGATERSKALVKCMPTEISVSPGEAGNSVKVYCLIDVCVMTPGEEEVAVDIYSYTHNTSVKENTLKYGKMISFTNGNMSVNGSFQASGIGMAESERAIAAYAEIKNADLSLSETKKAFIGGDCVFSVLTADDSGEIPEYSIREASLPFKYEIPDRSSFPVKEDNVFFIADITPVRAGARFDGERLGVDAEVFMTVAIIEEDEKRVVSELTECDKLPERGNGIKIVYPEKGESLWKIAKEKCMPISEIRRKNGITEDAKTEDTAILTGRKYLIV